MKSKAQYPLLQQNIIISINEDHVGHLSPTLKNHNESKFQMIQSVM